MQELSCLFLLKKLRQFSDTVQSTVIRWRGGRVVECGGLENRYPLRRDRGFESHPLLSKKAQFFF